MKFVLTQIPLHINEDEALLKDKIAQKLGADDFSIRIVRRSLDARKKSDILFKYTIEVDVADERLSKRLLSKGYEVATQPPSSPIKYGNQPIDGEIVVVGAGPCGLICAYLLALHGYKPILIDRGKPTHLREKDFAALCDHGTLDPESNVCFGEGGAGAFSDGKLTTRIKDARAHDVLSILIEHGAPASIALDAKPHLGTEVIRQVVANIRQSIIALGGKVLYGARLTNIKHKDAQLTQLCLSTGETIETNCAVLAIGHSARDTYSMLHFAEVALQPKSFAIGVRCEHLREFIDNAQFGKFAGHPRLGAAEYRVSAQPGNLGVYSFCMCPGGVVVCSSSEKEHLCINGMSYQSRNMRNSNSAIVVSVDAQKFSSALEAIEFQRKYEKLAYNLAPGYGAPVQKLGDFMKNVPSKSFGNVLPSYKPYTVFANIGDALPEQISRAIVQGFEHFGKVFKGFNAEDTLLTGIETRTSSPVRILRNELLQSNIKGLYPGGEGAGYAGGIVSAAVDGIKIAQQIMSTYKK